MPPHGNTPWRGFVTKERERIYRCRTCTHVWSLLGGGDMGVREGRHWAICPRCNATRQTFVIWTIRKDVRHAAGSL